MTGQQRIDISFLVVVGVCLIGLYGLYQFAALVIILVCSSIALQNIIQPSIGKGDFDPYRGTDLPDRMELVLHGKRQKSWKSIGANRMLSVALPISNAPVAVKFGGHKITIVVERDSDGPFVPAAFADINQLSPSADVRSRSANIQM